MYFAHFTVTLVDLTCIFTRLNTVLFFLWGLHVDFSLVSFVSSRQEAQCSSFESSFPVTILMYFCSNFGVILVYVISSFSEALSLNLLSFTVFTVSQLLPVKINNLTFDLY